MSDESDKTVRIRRNSKVGTDDRGRTVWTRPIEEVELELVSTAMLEQLLQSGDENQRDRMRALAELDDGILAMDRTSREFETITGDELESALRSAGGESGGHVRREAPRTAGRDAPSAEAGQADAAEELSLVTTQMLRKILAGEEPGEDEPADEPRDAKKPKGGGYNPYDRG